MNIELFCNGKKIENASWKDVEAVLPELEDEADFGLSIMPWPKTGPASLSVESEDGNYLPTMLITGEGYVRGFVNQSGRDKEDVSIGGYNYDAMSVTQDFDLIVRMIKEFYETGDVSKDLLK